MAGNEKFLTDIRESVKAMTEADPYYGQIAIITERIKNIEFAIDQKIGITGGICMVLVTPTVGGVLANVPGANFSGIRLMGRVLENVKLNATDKEALDVAIYTAALWSQLRPDQLSSALRPDEPVISLGNDPKYLSYDVAFLLEGGTQIQIPRLDAPAINASDPAAVVLSTTTAGAALFFTLDGSVPVPRNPTAALFLAPFAGPAGATLRARAWLAGYLPSLELRRVF